MNKIAIVIPYYKIDFFEETLQSVAKQTDQRFTLYIGNDASPDNPLPLIKKYLGHVSYFYYDYKENLGGKNLTLQWERILGNVKEDWVQILGDDDTIAENFVEEFYKLLTEVEAKNIKLIKCGFYWIDEHTTQIENNVYKFDEIAPTDLFIKKYKGEIRSSLSENIYKTKLLKEKKFIKLPLAWGTDDLSLITISENKNIKYIPKHLINVRVTGKSISGSKEHERTKQIAVQELKKKIILDFYHQFPTDFIRQVITDYIEAAHYKNVPIDERILLFYLKKGELISFLKVAKKIYYIKKKYAQ